MENDKTIKVLETVLNSTPIDEQIEETNEYINELFNLLVPVCDEADLLFEFDRFKAEFEKLIKLHEMQSYRDGFKAGVMLFTC